MLDHQASSTVRGSTRSSAACDRCRLRKVKCNGREPCQRCRQYSGICVYSKAAQQESEPMSGAYVSMLRSQQRRLVTALKNMSAVIEGRQQQQQQQQHMPHWDYSDGDDDFDLTEVLERYAPCNKAKDMQQQQLLSPQPRGRMNKKRWLQDDPAKMMATVPELSLQPMTNTDAAMDIDTSKLLDQSNGLDLATYNVQGHTMSMPGEQVESSAGLPHYEASAETTLFIEGNPDTLNPPWDSSTGDGTDLDWLNLTEASWTRPAGGDGSNNINLEQLYGMIDWNASWQSCADLLPLIESPVMPDEHRTFDRYDETTGWEEPRRHAEPDASSK